ncbi:MAG: hypothetical protein ACP5G1_03360, partial [Nanopusillaceae archaeon]
VATKMDGIRNPLSGKNSRNTSGDVIHDLFYIEVKHRQRIPFYSEFKKTRIRAKKEGKIPIFVIHEKYSRNYLAIIDLDDFKKLQKAIDDLILK